MMRTDHHLQGAFALLEQRADDYGAPDLLAPTRPRRHTVGPILASCAAVAAVVAVVVMVGGAVASHRPDAHPRPPAGSDAHSLPPVASPPGLPSPTTAAPTPKRRVAATQFVWRFSVGRVPGYDITRVGIDGESQSADVSYSGAPKSVGDIQLYQPGAFDAATFTQAQPVSVNGRPGRFGLLPDPATGSPGVRKPAVAWQYADNAWVVVQGDWGQRPVYSYPPTYDTNAARTAELAIALAVHTGVAQPLLLPFTLGWLPSGSYPEQAYSTQEGTALGFGDGRPGDPHRADTDGSAFTVSRSVRMGPSPGTPLNINGHHGYVGPGWLVLVLPDGTEFGINVDARHSLSRADLIAIARHATFTAKLADRTTWTPAPTALR